MDVAGKMGTASARPALDLAWTHRSLRRLWQSPFSGVSVEMRLDSASRVLATQSYPESTRTIFIEHAGILWFRQVLTAC
jgi:hypothetical protein